MLSVIKRVMDTIFLSATKRMVCATQLAVAVQNFINDSYGLSNTEINSKDYITRFMESYSITNMCCKHIEEIKQQVARLLQTIITTFEGRDFCVSVFPQVEQRH